VISLEFFDVWYTLGELGVGDFKDKNKKPTVMVGYTVEGRLCRT
jgi:hypothetical protein